MGFQPSSVPGQAKKLHFELKHLCQKNNTKIQKGLTLPELFFPQIPKQFPIKLVVSTNPFEKYATVKLGSSSPNRGENKRYWKPPTSIGIKISTYDPSSRVSKIGWSKSMVRMKTCLKPPPSYLVDGSKFETHFHIFQGVFFLEYRHSWQMKPQNTRGHYMTPNKNNTPYAIEGKGKFCEHLRYMWCIVTIIHPS